MVMQPYPAQGTDHVRNRLLLWACRNKSSSLQNI